MNIRDLSSNFYCHEEDVGKISRATACLRQLKDLNPYVHVEVHDGEINTEYLKHFDVVVFTDFYDKKKLIEFNEFCRSQPKPIGFILGGSLGLYGFTFVDFGPSFTNYDPNGEDPRTAIISGITKGNPGLVCTHEDKRHGYEDGNHIIFKEVKGMTEINGQTYQIKVLSPTSFTIGDTSSFSPYERNGIAEQVKVPQQLKFKSLKETLTVAYGDGIPPFENPDLEKWGRPEHLHLAINGIFEFYQRHNRLPYLNDENEAFELYNIVEKHNSELKTQMQIEGLVTVETVDQELVKNIARYAQAQISPIASFWGGIIAQEVVKHTGKFMPIRQWLHYEIFESLPEANEVVDRSLANSRYDDQIAIFGRQFQELLLNQKFFLVGAGALGCEFIKMFALMGVACGPKGKLTVTDDDNIEISNLNRQFLFRKENVGHSKSSSAGVVGKRMNPHLNVEALRLRVAPENEEVFDDEFWDGLDAVVNAVDNVKARLFVDSRCVFYTKHLFESGTLGTKSNSQVIVPFKTQSYGDSQDPPEESIPLCTLKNFPYQIEHTIQWGRDFFEGTFVEGPNEFNKYLEDPEGYITSLRKEVGGQTATLRARLETISKLQSEFEKASQENCIVLAKKLFQDIFHNMIASLLYNFPHDHRIESGQLFWSGPKRCPKALDFDPNDKTHIELIFHTANLFAYIFGLPEIKDKAYAAKVAASVETKEFQPKKVKINETTGTTIEEKGDNEDDYIEELANKLLVKKPLNYETKRVNTIEFEKDDDSNHHIDFIAAVANLRARNYSIDEAERFKIKLIAGKIIPAVATTTAMVVGAVGFEILKFLMRKPIEKMRNSFSNLAIPLWLFSEPIPPIKNTDKENDPVLLGPVKAIPSGNNVLLI